MAKKGKNVVSALTKAAQKAAAAMQKQKAVKTVTAKNQQASNVFPTAKKQNDRPSALKTSRPQKAGQGKSAQSLVSYRIGEKQRRRTAAAGQRNQSYLPLSGDYRVSSSFGVDRVTHRHSGIDLAVAEGTKVSAVKAGQVSFAGWGNGYGYRVVIDHADGTQTTYNHLSDIGVKVGDTVAAGHAIALSGNTGNSTGPHLHFEVKKDGQYVDPALYFDFGAPSAAPKDSTYTSQMASLSTNSDTSRPLSTASAVSRQTSTGSAKKTKKSTLPRMDFPTAKVTFPSVPKAAPPRVTAYKASYRGVDDYFDGRVNPLASLIPQYSLKSFRD